jgi:hypothetical protein
MYLILIICGPRLVQKFETTNSPIFPLHTIDFFLSEKNWKYFSSVYAEKMSVVFHNNIFVFSIDKKLDVKIEGDIEAAQSMKSTPELFAEVGKYLS